MFFIIPIEKYDLDLVLFVIHAPSGPFVQFEAGFLNLREALLKNYLIWIELLCDQEFILKVLRLGPTNPAQKRNIFA